MLLLRNLQIDFKDAILQSADVKTNLENGKNIDLNSRITENELLTFLLTQQNSLLDMYITENNLTAKERLQIYRNNIFITLTETLHHIYPAIYQLVGNDFFTGVAHKYIAQHLPTSGDLHEYGHLFAEFLADFPPAQTLPYIHEMARLEWAYHKAFHAADCLPLDLRRLKKIPEQNYSNLQFILNSSISLLDFRFPILSIWEMCQNSGNTEEKINLDAGGEKILVIRRQLEITFERLNTSEFILLTALHNGTPVAEACSLALNAEPECNINVYLEKHLLTGTIVDFRV